MGEANLEAQGNLLKLAAHAIKLFNIASRADEILGLDLAGAHLSVLGARLDLLYECLFLLLELDAGLVELSDGLVEHALVLAQTFGGRHALAKHPFEHLGCGWVSGWSLGDGQWSVPNMERLHSSCSCLGGIICM